MALCRRPNEGLLSGLYEPYCLSGHRSPEEVISALADLGISPLRITPLEASKHIFTHLEWHMTGFEILLDEENASRLPQELFLAPREEIDTVYALPSAYRAYRPYM